MKLYEKNQFQKAEKFVSPIYIPTDELERQELLADNKNWWENNPMRYDWNDEIKHEEFSKSFFQEIDNRFFSASSTYFPWKNKPFEQLIDFEAIKNQSVLEIGVGNGSHAQLLASNAKEFTGIDLTNYAVKSTTARMKTFGLDNAKIVQMNAEEISFPNNSFDFIWSWGVIHHSANTNNIIQHMNRVLKPGGKSTIMVYYRGWYNYFIIGFLFHGILKGDIFKTWSLHRTIQNSTDGAIARYYTKAELRETLEQFGFTIDKVAVYGDKIELIPLPAGKFKQFIYKLIPNSVARFLNHTCSMGNFLVASFQKPK